ncbi:glycosyl transferase [archaeon]|nr:glycosyl transferase [archaeon]
MNRIISKISENKDKNFFYSLTYNLLYSSHNFLMKLIPSKLFISYQYQKNFGKKLDLKNPQTLNEKIQWKKIYDKNPLCVTLADKYAVRKVIEEKIGKEYLIPLQFHTTDPNKIPFDNLKFPAIIKSNHASGQIIVLKDNRNINKKEIIKKCKRWLKTNYYNKHRELQYRDIPPKILIEKLLLNDNGKIPEDYKFNCFNGNVEFIQIVRGRFENKSMGFFDSKWNLLPFIWCEEKDGKPSCKKVKSFKKPKNLKKMIKIAEKLSKEFNYVRVDLYSIKNKIYFGELTLGHGAGLQKFYPDSWDKFYGDKLKLD